MVELSAGDALFVPSGWWHHVRSFDTSLAVSLFWRFVAPVGSHSLHAHEKVHVREFFPVSFDIGNGVVALIPFREEEFRSLLFHDAPYLDRAGLFKVDLEESRKLFPGGIRMDPNRRARYIFHTAFCGSTLLARTLDSAGSRFCYREPGVLNSLGWQRQWKVESPTKWKRAIEWVYFMLSRWASAGEVPIVKTHNNALGLVGDLLTPHLAAPAGTALFLYSSLEDYLLSVLKTQQRREWVRDQLSADTVIAEIARPYMPSKLTDAEAAALCWVAHIAAYSRSIEENGYSAVPRPAGQGALSTTQLHPPSRFELARPRAQCRRVPRNRQRTRFRDSFQVRSALFQPVTAGRAASAEKPVQ